jgi:hypothetical protein
MLFFEKELESEPNHRRPFLNIQSKEEHLEKLVERFWMEQSTPHDDDLATPIQDDLLLEKIKKLLTRLPLGKLQIPCFWKTKCVKLKKITLNSQRKDFSRYCRQNSSPPRRICYTTTTPFLKNGRKPTTFNRSTICILTDKACGTLHTSRS